MSSTPEVHPFQAEAREVLGLMIHSLYTSKDIFLRELISNGSDALDRLRVAALTNPSLVGDDHRFEIRLEVDPGARTLTVSDSGIGMSRDDVAANIGTIAASATRELRRQLTGDGGVDPTRLIGQFGVGFYSVFMIADRVRLVTRRAGETTATLWESDGDGVYAISDGVRDAAGTSVTLFLKPADPDNGIEDYIDSWRLSSIVKKYSDFIRYPVVTTAAADTLDADDEAATAEAAADRVLNSMRAIWRRPAAEVTAEEHTEFYREITHDWSEPLETIRFRAEGTVEYDALLYLPAAAPYDLYYVAPRGGLKLFANCVLIMDECQELLPGYLRFVRGVVDVGDLPLNVSRQRLQQDRQIAMIRKRLTRKILDAIQQLHDKDPERYGAFWKEFGRALKEGISADAEHKDRLVELARFASSHDAERAVSLAEYVGRMPEAQQEIYYLTGESRRILEHSPHLEALRQRQYEVLYMTEPVDELVLQHVTVFAGKRLKSAAKGALGLEPEAEREQAAQDRQAREKAFLPLIEYLARALEAEVKQVRLSSRLTDSAVCLVVDEHEYSPMLERVLHKGQPGRGRQRRVLEVNPDHPVITGLRERVERDRDDPGLGHAARVLHGLALLLEGSDLSDPVGFSQAAHALMAGVLGAAAPAAGR